MSPTRSRQPSPATQAAPRWARPATGWGRPALALSLAATALLPGCTSPLDRSAEQELHDSLIASHQRQLEAIAGSPRVTVDREPSEVERSLSPQRLEKLDEISGRAAYADQTPDLGDALTGENDPDDTVELSLPQAVRQAVDHNLDVRVARLSPAIARTQVTQAQAAFDSVLFGSAQWEKLDTPQPGGTIPGLASDRQSENLTLTTGIRKDLVTGTRLTFQTDFTHQDQRPSFFASPSFYNADVRFQVDQPLLRGFGVDVNRARIVLARSARRSQLQQLKADLLQTVQDVERAYWDLDLARGNLLIQQRLLGRTQEDRDRLVKRQDFDVSPVRITEANSFVELRRGEVIRARQRVRAASDRLKSLINSPDLPVAGETLIVPTDRPVDQPIRFSLLDSVTTALQQRPELKRALLAIKDSSVRQRVADNARLPLLNLTAAVAYNGLDVDNGSGAYEDLADGDYIDYILGGNFEYPLGNRRADAEFQQRRLERRQAVLEYQQAARDVVVQVKDAMRQVASQYELIGSARAARRAAADSLRAIGEQEDAGVAITPEFLLDLKLQTQQRLADAEVQEAQALADYNTAISRFYQTLGTLLKRNQIRFEDQDFQ